MLDVGPLSRPIGIALPQVTQPTVDLVGSVDRSSGNPIDRIFTVAANANLMTIMLFSSNGQTPTSMTWDQGGTNQGFTEISRINGVGPLAYILSLWGLINPTPGTKTFRIVNDGGIQNSFVVSTYIGAAATLAAAIQTVDIQKDRTNSDNQWNVTQAADQNFTFDAARKIGIIFNCDENGVSSNNSWTPAPTSADGLAGLGYLRKLVSPVQLRITPGTPPDGGLGGMFYTVAGA